MTDKRTKLMWWLVCTWAAQCASVAGQDLWSPDGLFTIDESEEDDGFDMINWDEFWSVWDWDDTSSDGDSWSVWDTALDFDWLIGNTEGPTAAATTLPNDLFSFDILNSVQLDRYWTGNPEIDWCRDTLPNQAISDMSVTLMISDFIESGNITNWCIYPNQVMVVSDLSNVNLNDPAALPALFQQISGHCTEGVCERQMEKQKRLDATRLITRVWKLLKVYTKIDCKKCFCKSDEKKDLEHVMAITKDHLKNNEFLRYNVTEESPEEVVEYFNKRKQELGLANVELPQEIPYYTLYSMDEAIEGPGAVAQQIDQYSQLTRGLWAFCQDV